MSAMAPTLADVPVEVLRTILFALCLHCTGEHDYDAPDGYFKSSASVGGQHQDSRSWYSRDYCGALYASCLVSRRFLPVAQPLLYHAFLPGYGDSWQSKVFSWEQRLQLFLRTVSQRPDLASSVRHIYIHPELVRRTSPEQAQKALDDAARLLDGDLNVAQYTAHFDAMLKEFGHAQWKLDSGALLGLLLAFVPNLQRLSLQVTEPGVGIPAPAFQALARAKAPATGPLSRLRRLDLCNHSEGGTLFSLDHHATGLFEAAKHSLESLELHMCGESSRCIGKDTLHLRHLHITHSHLIDIDFDPLISACAPGLETFVYEASYHYTPSISCVIDPSEYLADTCQAVDHLIHHLDKFKATLKSLHLDLRSRQRTASWEGGNIIPLSGEETLRDFNALQHVFISTCCLGGAQEAEIMDADLLTRLLPPNIETLALAGDMTRRGASSRRLTGALKHLADTVAQGSGSRFDALRCVRCDVSMAQAFNDTAIPELFNAAGVDFGYEDWPLSEATVAKGARSKWVYESDHHWPIVPMPMPPKDDCDGEL